MKTYFVKGYGYQENGNKFEFATFIDLEEVNSKTFTKALEDFAALNPHSKGRTLYVDSVVLLN